MAYSMLKDFESGEMERVFCIPMDPIAGHFRLLFVDPLNWNDTADMVLECIEEQPMWGNA